VTIRTLRRGTLPYGVRSSGIILFAALAWGAQPVLAAVDLSAHATTGVDRNSNPNELGNGEGQPLGTDGTTRQGDTATRLAAGVVMSAGSGPGLLRLEGDLAKVQYDRYGALDHTEHTFRGTLDWKPSKVFDSSLLASVMRTPAGQADIGGNSIALQTVRRAETTLRLRPTPRWQLSLTPGWNDQQTPLVGSPDFRFREYTGIAALGFTGAGRVVPGVRIGEVHGKYFGIQAATRYQQQTAEVTANYQATGFSSFALAVGKTTRTTKLIEPSNDPVALATEGRSSGFTGSLGYNRTVSVKTSFNVSAFRSFRNYDAGLNTEIGTGYTVGINWNPTVKSGLNIGFLQTWSKIEALGIGAANNNRRDVLSSITVGGSYVASRRFAVRPHYTRRIRTSNAVADQFNATVAGIDLTVTID
jgi:hypothetical protein